MSNNISSKNSQLSSKALKVIQEVISDWDQILSAQKKLPLQPQGSLHAA